MRFESWGFLLLILLVPILFRYWMKWNQSPSIKFSVPIGKVARKANPTRWLMILNAVGLGLVLIALARPQKSYQQAERKVSGVDIMVVMDVSASMRVEDLADRPRIDVAKDTIKSFVKGRNNDRIGFIIFSGEPFTMAPPTLDYGLVLKAIQDSEIGKLRDGTAIGDGLSLAVARLRKSTAKSRVVILLTDGDNNIGQIDPATAGELAAGYGIRVYTIAIGKEGRVKIPIRHKTAFGDVVTTYQYQDNALNPELLKQIASSTEGKFFRVSDESTLKKVFAEIDELEKTEQTSREWTRYQEAYETPLKFALILLMLERLLALFRWRFVP